MTLFALKVVYQVVLPWLQLALVQSIPVRTAASVHSVRKTHGLFAAVNSFVKSKTSVQVHILFWDRHIFVELHIRSEHWLRDIDAKISENDGPGNNAIIFAIKYRFSFNAVKIQTLEIS